ncbi:unnamed protein product [Lactuca virosa]|uniref:Uncharacterized protein n=1 Tax=Lactuca virosa TaxID=75947 RepID=A0AAU9P010_9ASTR|nr:unnamed protein product [Lactuca virosa]
MIANYTKKRGKGWVVHQSIFVTLCSECMGLCLAYDLIRMKTWSMDGVRTLLLGDALTVELTHEKIRVVDGQ